MYCNGIGSFSRYCWRISSSTLGSRSSPAMISAGSPGRSCCRPKISIDTRISVGMICSSRWVRKASTLLQLHADHAHQPVGHLLVAFDLVGERHQHLHVVEVEDRALGEEFLVDDFVGLLALRRIARGARYGGRRVDLLIAELAVVLRRVARLEDERIAVGIPAPAPAVHIERVVAVVALLERSRELGDSDL